MILLCDLAAQVLEYVADDPEGVVLSLDEIYTRLDCWSTSNPHLVNPSRHPDAGWSRPRDQPLSGQESVYGDYLLFEWCPHDLAINLREFQSLQAMESSLLSAGGAFCPFLEYLVPFINAKIAPFRIAFRSADGQTATFPKYHGSKWPQYGPDALDQVFPDRAVEWMNA